MQRIQAKPARSSTDTMPRKTSLAEALAEKSQTYEERAYQDEAVRFALANLEQHGGYACFMEQRTGKTIVACRIVAKILPARLLVVCPEIAIQVWKEHLPQAIKSIEHSFKQVELKIITRDQVFKQRTKLARWIKKAEGGGMVIADEGHDYKDHTSKRSRGLRIIGRRAKWKLLLTGTPQESGLEDYWAQMDFVDDQLFGEWATFKSTYLVYGGFRRKEIIAYRNRERFQKLLHSRSYRVLLEDVKPVKTRLSPPNEIHFDLDASRQAYDDMEKKFILELNEWVYRKELQADGSYQFVKRRKFVAAARVITQAMKLHQLSGGFVIDEESRVHRFGNEKLETAGCLMLAIGEQVPQVWYARFSWEIDRLGQLFTILGREVTYISGRHKSYRSGDPFDIAIVQIASGQSIDLAHAEEAIFYSWDYSHLKHDQAKFRIRAYHGRRARYHYLIARHTIDQVLYDAATGKASFASLVLDQFRT